MAKIQKRYIGNTEGEDKEWRHYVTHRNWDNNRAQESVDRLNKLTPKSWEYRVKGIEMGSVLTNGIISSISDHVTLYQNPDCPYHYSSEAFVKAESQPEAERGK